MPCIPMPLENCDDVVRWERRPPPRYHAARVNATGRVEARSCGASWFNARARPSDARRRRCAPTRWNDATGAGRQSDIDAPTSSAHTTAAQATVKRNRQMARHAANIQAVTENLRSGFSRKLLKTGGNGPPRPFRETFHEYLRYR